MIRSSQFDFQAASEAIELMKSTSSLDEFATTFSGIVRKIGYRYFVISGIPGPYEELDKFIVVKDLPDCWEALYKRKRYVDFDPIIERCISSEHPFRWSEVINDPGIRPEALAVMSEAGRYGLINGLCIPIHGVNGYEAGVSLSGRDAGISNEELNNVHMVCLYSFNILKTIVRDSVISVSQLTKREKEILSWAALGKTNRDIAQSLFLAEETVASHMKSAMKKLSAQNKAEAVATALRARIIPG